MKKIIIIISIVLLVVGIAYVAITREQQTFDEEIEKEFIVDTNVNQTPEERSQTEWEILCDDMEETLKDLDEVETITITPKSYVEYEKSEKVLVTAVLKDGCSVDSKWKEDLQSYVSATLNCDQVKVVTE